MVTNKKESTFMTVIYWDKDKSACVFHVTDVTKDVLKEEFTERKISDVKRIKSIKVEKGNKTLTVFLDEDIKDVLNEWGIKLNQ